jgi:hypothetical protein
MKGYSAAVFLIAMIVAGGASAAAQQANPKITGLGQEALSVKAKSGEDSAVAYVSVLNAGSAAARIQVTFQAASSDRIRVTKFQPQSAAPGATRVAVTLTGLTALKEEAEGQLLVTGGAEPVARAVKITPAPQPSRDWAATIFWLTVIVFALLYGAVVAGLALTKRLPSLGKLAPGPKWSFESWATTLTAVGAILGTVIGDVTLPEVPRRVDKETLIELNLIFGVLLVVGPFVFQAVRARSASADDQEAGLTGYTWALLLACSLTAAAVLGELATLGLMGTELTEKDVWRTVIWVAAGLLCVLALLYFSRTSWELATTDWEEQARKAAAAAKKPQKVIVVSRGRASRRRPGVLEARERTSDQGAEDEEVEEDELDEAAASAGATSQAVRLSWRMP